MSIGKKILMMTKVMIIKTEKSSIMLVLKYLSDLRYVAKIIIPIILGTIDLSINDARNATIIDRKALLERIKI
tara:strand:- start:11 stop:229 length:219 start_codon:yes stop_codon:yes gene_type:complete